MYVRSQTRMMLDSMHAYEEATELLSKHDLKHAEAQFRCILQNQTPASGEDEEIVAGSLVGLAEIYFKQVRRVGHSVPEWYRMLLISSMFHGEALKILNTARKVENIGVRKSAKLDKLARRSETQLEVLENALIESLPKHLSVVTKGAWSTERVSDATQRWLTALCRYCTDPRHVTEIQHEPQDHDDDEAEDLELENQSTENTVSRKIDFDKVHNGILGLVKQIAGDLRMRHAKLMTCEQTLRRSVSVGMLNQLKSPGSSDILSLFEEAITFNDSENDLSCPDIYEQVEESQRDQLDHFSSCTSTDSFQSNVSAHDEESSATDIHVYQQITDSISCTQSDLSISEIEYPSHGYIGNPNRKVEIPGVITHWKAYSKEHPYHLHRKHKLENFEELSPLCEISHFSGQPTDGQEFCMQTLFDPNVASSGSRLKYKFGCVVAKSAELLQEEGHWREAVDLYKFSLGVFEDFSVHQVDITTVAGILKNLGVIKCAHNQVECGVRLLEEAMELYGGEDVDNVHVADTLLAIGKGYLTEHNESSSLFSHAMRLVKNDVENDVSLDEIRQSPHEVDSDSDSECSESEATYSICTEEAASCFRQALSMLSRLRNQNQPHTCLRVDVLISYGDCCFLAGNYDRAVSCYEEAMVLFPETSGTSLTGNAHVLSMLGTANFLLGNYTKAASMYETATVLQRHLQGAEEDVTISSAFTLTMLGITLHKSKLYHKSVGWCYKARDQYIQMYKTGLIFIPPLHLWFICQNLYNMGFAYSTINFNDEALNNFQAAHDMITKSHHKNIIQLVKILKSTADVCHTKHEHTAALKYYDQALEETHHMGEGKSAVALQNQLLNCIASVHVTTKEYGDAAGYLNQALDCQRSMQSSIQGDFLGIMYQLGITYTLSGDVDKAIESYKECLDIYDGMHGPVSSAMIWILCNVATLYYVKACLLDDDDCGSDDDEEHSADYLLDKADQCYKEALALDLKSNVAIHYANFLYQQGRSADALLTMLPCLFGTNGHVERSSLVFNGVEQAVLPDCLRNETQDVDEFTIDSQLFAHLLALLCYKELALLNDAVDCLVTMSSCATLSPSSLNYSLFGYALLEMNMFDDAAEAFLDASHFEEEDSSLAMSNAILCMCLWVYTKISTGVQALWDYLYAPIYIVIPVRLRKRLSIIDRRRASCSQTSDDSSDEMYSVGMQKTLSASSSILDAIRRKTAMLNVQEKGRYSGSSEKIDLLATIREATSRDRSQSRSPNLRQTSKVNSESSESELHEWEEEETNTPSFLLDYLNQSPHTSDREIGQAEACQHGGDEEEKEGEEEEEEQVWMMSETLCVDTPEEILRLLESGALLSDYVTTSSTKKGPTSPQAVRSEPTTEETSSDNRKDDSGECEESQYDGDEWMVTEEVVDTPIELLRYIRRTTCDANEESITSENIISNIRQQQQHKRHEEEINHNRGSDDVCASRETTRYSRGNFAFSGRPSQDYTPSIATSDFAHDRLNGNVSTSAVTYQTPHITHEAWQTVTDDENNEEEWQCWETEEVVVDTPAEIIQLLRRQQQQKQQQQQQ